MDIKPYLKYYIGVAKVKLKESPWTVWTLDGSDVKYIEDNPHYLSKIEIYLKPCVVALNYSPIRLHEFIQKGLWVFGNNYFKEGIIKELKDLEV